MGILWLASMLSSFPLTYRASAGSKVRVKEASVLLEQVFSQHQHWIVDQRPVRRLKLEDTVFRSLAYVRGEIENIPKLIRGVRRVANLRTQGG